MKEADPKRFDGVGEWNHPGGRFEPIGQELDGEVDPGEKNEGTRDNPGDRVPFLKVNDEGGGDGP